MEDLEVATQKYVANFCKILPSHLEAWKSLQENASKSLHSLVNFSEQLNHIEKSQLQSSLDNFECLQNTLQYLILSEIDEEILNLKQIIERLNQANLSLKTRLSVLEKSTLDLDWDQSSSLISGSGTQPPLGKLLQRAYTFFMYFSLALKQINECFKLLDVREHSSVIKLKNAFNVDLCDENVTFLLALTQYVGNEKGII